MGSCLAPCMDACTASHCCGVCPGASHSCLQNCWHGACDTLVHCVAAPQQPQPMDCLPPPPAWQDCGYAWVVQTEASLACMLPEALGHDCCRVSSPPTISKSLFFVGRVKLRVSFHLTFHTWLLWSGRIGVEARCWAQCTGHLIKWAGCMEHTYVTFYSLGVVFQDDGYACTRNAAVS